MEQDKDKLKKSEMVSSRRKFLTKAGIAAPVVLTMASKPAFGTTVCNISGYASINPSGVARHKTTTCGGKKRGSWKNAKNKKNRRQLWYNAGLAPRPRSGSGNVNYMTKPGVAIVANKNKSNQDPPATKFNDVFTHSTNDTEMEVVVNGNNTLDRAAAVAVLNALAYNWGPLDKKISPQDIVLLHKAASNGAPSFRMTGGSMIDLQGVDVKQFLNDTQH